MWYMDNSYGIDVPFGGDLDQIYFQGHPKWTLTFVVEILVNSFL